MLADTLPPPVDPAVNLAQQALYRFTALALLDPRAGAWEQLDALLLSTLFEDAAEIVRGDSAAWPARLGPGELPAAELNPTSVLSALPKTADELNRQYEAAFGLLVSSACPPYETEYVNGKFAVQRAQTLADINGFYNAFGLKPSTAHPERCDHIVLQLEFMAFLFGLELQAAEDDSAAREERIRICRAARERFFREHLAWWAPAFARLLARKAGDSFYGRAARLLSALLTTQRARDGLPAPQGAPWPSTLERPEECEGCALASV
jgi:TorA maturation chaperone TorD